MLLVGVSARLATIRGCERAKRQVKPSIVRTHPHKREAERGGGDITERE